ncbi:MAG: alpha/beta fold hydrolase [Bacteroidota bacterium]|nr:alpha/beta fold hydrolase [Bacteroidota bacterium]
MKLFCRKYGSGPPLIILHGLYGSSDNWITIARNLSGKFTVYLPDQRNHGMSPHSDHHDYDSMRDDLFELAEDLGLGKFFLAGHSMGGKTAMNFAIRWPEKLYGLLIADISPLRSESSERAVSKEHLAILHTILSFDLSRFSSRSEIETALASDIKDDETRGLIMKNIRRESDNAFVWKLNAEVLLRNFDRILKGIVLPDNIPGEIITGFPVYFLKGELSGYFPDGDFRELLKIFPAAEFIVVPGAGHWLHTDNPEMVTKCFLKFLE